MEKSVKKLGEFELIEYLKSTLRASESFVGIGDDCAVFSLSANKHALLTIDTLIENVHFNLEYSSAEDIGWKSATVNISDISAMGGKPEYALISLTLTDKTEVEFVEKLYAGINEAFNSVGAFIVGGDTVKGREFSISVSLFGTCTQKPVLRSGARVGDNIWVSGEIGGASLGLAVLEGRYKIEDYKNYVARHQRPPIRNEIAKEIGKFASSMIDVSDGLLQDLGHITTQSKVSALVDIEKIPLSKYDTKAINLLELLSGGDDYELLFTASRTDENEILKLADFCPLTQIGEIVEGSGIKLFDSNNHYSLEEYAKLQNYQGKFGYSHF